MTYERPQGHRNHRIRECQKWVGAFLSVDPVTADDRLGHSSNRYWYANNNPYRFVDPDGRDAADRAYGAVVAYRLRNDPERLRIWLGGEAAATTEGSAAEEGAAMGLAFGRFVDTGDYSRQAVAQFAIFTAFGILTHGRYRGPMRGFWPKVHPGKQGKHQLGHNNYVPGKSILTADPEELAKFAGTGKKANSIDVGLPGSKERVDFGRVIGTYVDDKTGLTAPTTNGMIIYAKDGIHIVPIRPNP
ncbi:polymorphic toxin type 50 domain-containing protein [Lysobacter sp. 2RAF19]